MKRCPICDQRYDDSLSFCQTDGAMLEAVAESGTAGMWRDESASGIQTGTPLAGSERPGVTFGDPTAMPNPGLQWTPPPATGAWREAAGSPAHMPLPGGQDKGLATWSMVLGVLGIACCGVFTAIPAIVLGVMAKNNISRQPERYGGSGLATAGIVLGIVGTVLSILAVIFQLALVMNDSSSFSDF